MNSTKIAQKIQDVLSQPLSEKEKAQVYLQILSAYIKTATDLNKEYNAQLETAIKDLEHLKKQEARLTK